MRQSLHHLPAQAQGLQAGEPRWGAQAGTGLWLPFVPPRTLEEGTALAGWNKGKASCPENQASKEAQQGSETQDGDHTLPLLSFSPWASSGTGLMATTLPQSTGWSL